MQTKLSEKQRAIIPIAASTASGDLDGLKPSLEKGLDAGLTVNEIKEILVQMYAYAGFPRSLNGIGTFMAVVDERRARGCNDEMGKQASPLPAGKTSLEFGTKNQTRLVGQPVLGPVFNFAPVIDQFLKAHLFGDIFQRDVLGWGERELATVAGLACIKGVNGQLRSHYAISINNGITPEQLCEFVTVLETWCGPAVAQNAKAVLEQVLKDDKQVTSPPGLNHLLFWKKYLIDNDSIQEKRMDSSDKTMGASNRLSHSFTGEGIFPKGAKNDAYARYFTGISYLEMLSMEGVVIGNVTFEPGCRNFWHIHHKGGQILMVTGGRGWYQEAGKKARELRAGDVVNIPPETRHWHGAAKDSWFAHVAVEVPAKGASNEWLDPVSDEEYDQLN